MTTLCVVEWHTHAFATALEVKQPLSHLVRDHHAARLHNAGGIRVGAHGPRRRATGDTLTRLVPRVISSWKKESSCRCSERVELFRADMASLTSLNLMSLMLRVAGPSVDQANANPATDDGTRRTLFQALPHTSHRVPDPPPSAAAPPWHPRQRFRTPLLLP